jgi:DNA-binding CsgD family transcriptional regulator
VGDRWGISLALNNLGDLATARAEHAEAERLLEESLALDRELGDQFGMAIALINLAIVARERGDYARAKGLCGEALVLCREQGARWEMAESLEVLAGVVSAQGQPGLAARLYGALETLRELTGAARLPTAEEAHIRWVKAAQAELGPDRFQVAWDDGRATPLDRLLAEAIDDRPAPQAAPRPPSHGLAGDDQAQLLTPREREVAGLIARGWSNRLIAVHLVVGERTVQTHVENILRKLDFRARTQIAVWARDHGLLTPPPE